jgi:hypothetical protein
MEDMVVFSGPSRHELMVALRRAQCGGWWTSWNVAVSTLVSKGWVRSDEYQLRDLSTGLLLAPKESQERLRRIGRRHGISYVTGPGDPL